METYDLIDFVLAKDRWKKIGPLNQIKSAIFTYTKSYSDFSSTNMGRVRNRFKNIGTCEVTNFTRLEQFQQLYQYYLPWYWPPTNEQIRFSKYMNEFTNRNVNLIEYVSIGRLAQSLRQGWGYKIEVIVAFDTIKNTGVIVDGAHHSLALCYLKEKEGQSFQRLLKDSEPVNLCKMSSTESRTLFHDDFKL